MLGKLQGTSNCDLLLFSGGEYGRVRRPHAANPHGFLAPLAVIADMASLPSR